MQNNSNNRVSTASKYYKSWLAKFQLKALQWSAANPGNPRLLGKNLYSLIDWWMIAGGCCQSQGEIGQKVLLQPTHFKRCNYTFTVLCLESRWQVFADKLATSIQTTDNCRNLLTKAITRRFLVQGLIWDRFHQATAITHSHTCLGIHILSKPKVKTTIWVANACLCSSYSSQIRGFLLLILQHIAGHWCWKMAIEDNFFCL